MKAAPIEHQPRNEAIQNVGSPSVVADPLEPLLGLTIACGNDLLGNYRELVFRGSKLLVRLDRDAPDKYRRYAGQYSSFASRLKAG
ncbi:MAG: hypothetical protein ACR2L2_08985 [Acidobacteriota bacterium]